MAWKISDGSKLVWKLWDDEYVVFNVGSGDTHLLDSIAAETLGQLERSPAHVSELIHRVSTALEASPSPELAARVEQLVAEFAALGLVDRLED